MPLIEIEQHPVSYQIERLEDIQFVKLYLDDLNGIKISAPASKPWDAVEAFLLKKADWIWEKWTNIHPDLYGVNEGERLPYLGRKYKLISETGQVQEPEFTFSKGKFIFTYPEHFTEEQMVTELTKCRDVWYKKKAEEKFPSLSESSVFIEEDHLRLGEKKADEILLNWRLIKRSKKEISRHIEDLKEEKTY
ncbi:YgjP-like metallopeptidase domain-containing protein [Halobacillus sp. Marseille-Q1614]|uniref:YgjP-like metallopeptidase domain-containing protein n=1 Tax=Halobacillus sp. Marseille-Q1614 TaxID=2709134 RepID=UPI001570EEE1|nr:YgjP-like metallopeptidase domain-containing protein [Halobacillus sp. Marseille-Q1614]